MKPRVVNVIAWIGGLVAFGYIVSVALTKSPVPTGGIGTIKVS